MILITEGTIVLDRGQGSYILEELEGKEDHKMFGSLKVEKYPKSLFYVLYILTGIEN